MRPPLPSSPRRAHRRRRCGELATEKLGFRHTRGGAWVVRDVDMRIPAGGKLAVVGSSGSGKSTLVKLLAGLYPAAEGTVSFDGRDLRSLDLASLRRRLGVVLQDPFLLAGTVAENIALRRPDAPLADVIAAAELAAVHDDIAGLPLGYATTLANGGAELSGGQCQPIALARSLLDRPGVFLLDEATSHLDSATEAQIERNLQGLSITRIVVAHRLSTVHDADLILVLEDGRVVESGTHGELVDVGGRYAAMVASQDMVAT